MSARGSFLPVMEAMVREGQTVPVPVAGHSMLPFLKPGRDAVIVSPAQGAFRRGEMVFYIRPGGQYVMHRVHHIREGTLYLVGDEQTEIEGPVNPEAVFGSVHEVIRRGTHLSRGSFCWWFFETIWIRLVPLRPMAFRCYNLLSRGFRHRTSKRRR